MQRVNIFGAIKTSEQATLVLKECSKAFYIFAVVLAIIVFPFGMISLGFAIATALLAFALRKFQSRAAAILLFAVSLSVIIASAFFPQTMKWGFGIGSFMSLVGIRAIQTSFLLQLPANNISARKDSVIAWTGGILLIIAILSLVGLLIAADMRGVDTLENRERPLTFDIPEGWEELSPTGDPSEYWMGKMGNSTLAVIVSQIPNTPPDAKTIQDVMSLELFGQAYIERMKTENSDISLVDSGIAEVAGEPAYWLIFDEGNKAIPSNMILMYSIFRRGTMYSIGVTSPSEEFEQVKVEVAKVLASLTFTE